MKRLLSVTALAVSLLAVFSGFAAADDFENFAVESAGVSLSTTQAGAHPDLTTSFRFTTDEGVPWAHARNIDTILPPGIAGNPQAFPLCTTAQFSTSPGTSHCPQDAQVGVIEVTLGGDNVGTFLEPVYNMVSPGDGVAARLGFYAKEFPTFINVRLRPDDHGLTASVEGAYGAAPFIGATATLWGVPASTTHDFERLTPKEAGAGTPVPKRESGLPEVPFMTNPTGCAPKRELTVSAVSYQHPELQVSKTVPFPKITGCGLLKFRPEISLTPTTSQAETGTGLGVELNLPTEGLQFPNLLSDAEVERTRVALPEGMTINPSQAEGLGVCSEGEFARETYLAIPDGGCPETSKIGSVTATTPVLAEPAEGSLYVAKPYENPFGSFIALYMTVKVPKKGVLVKLAGKVTPDPVSGRLVADFGESPYEIPDLPVSSFDLRFREGARAPLVTPPTCGFYQGIAGFTSWGGQTSTSLPGFGIDSGIGHSACPGLARPFQPDLVAGSLNNAAGSYSPFTIRLSREDGEQEITRFSIKLPPGISGKLSGIPFCSEAQIAAAEARTGPHGGQEEIDAPSCPGASEIGRTLAGAGVGQVLAYAPGKIYLAGPYNGSSLSIVAITAAKVGPFDLGTVVVRQALKVNPETAEVFVDATGSDPIPHIIQGIPLHLRDIRVYVDRPEFVLNPTDCRQTSTASTVLGSGTDFTTDADDRPSTVTSPYQAADCASLGFKPKLKLWLKGGTKRGQNPALKAVLTARKGDANIDEARVTLPHSEFLENAHIKTICTRVQFNAGGGNGEQCPAASVYGRAKAVTPILDEPLAGPVYLRSSNHPLPDLVAAMHSGKININLVGRIDSGKGGRIRNTFEAVPDAPVTTFTLEMFGGKKGLLVNSTNLCKGTHRAIAKFTGQNGRHRDFAPALTPRCGKKR